MRRRRRKRDHTRRHRGGRPLRHETDGQAHALPVGRHTTIQKAAQKRPAGGIGLLLQARPRHQLYQDRPCIKGPEVERRFGLRGYRHLDKPLETREGPEGHRGRKERAADRLPALPPLPRERRLRRRSAAPGTPDAAPDPLQARRRALVYAVFALRLLQRALHSAVVGAQPDEHHAKDIRADVRFHHRNASLFHRFKRGSADRRRFDPLARPYAGRQIRVPDGEGGNRRDFRYSRLSRDHCGYGIVADVGDQAPFGLARRPRRCRRPPARLLESLQRPRSRHLLRDGRRSAQHGDANCEAQGDRLRARPRAPQQHHERRTSDGSLPSARRQAQYQEGEHRPDRSHGPCDPPRKTEKRNVKACGAHRERPHGRDRRRPDMRKA